MRKKPTEADNALWQLLRFDQCGVRFRRQHPIKGRIIDFYCHPAKLGIEVDGEIHNQPAQQLLDQEREEYLNELGITLLHFRNEEIFKNSERVLSIIQKKLTETLPSPGGGRAGDGGKHSQQHTLHLGSLVRLSPEKGIDLLIEAVRDLPNVDLKIVGKGPEEKRLRDLIGSSNHLTIQPSITDLANFYQSLDALVLPSREHDPFGLVAAEAMLLGIPVLVTDACGIAGYLHDQEDAIIVRANDAKALREGIRQLQDETTRSRIAEQGRVTAKREFSLEKMVERYDALLHDKKIG